MQLESLYLLAVPTNIDTMSWIILNDYESDLTKKFLNFEENKNKI